MTGRQENWRPVTLDDRIEKLVPEFNPIDCTMIAAPRPEWG
jgi:hypothetical protein